ncbi:MAG: hypothetical protein MUF34_10375 [Polyangiaceae bacterium]|jgi:hypothetical protein|nr:hypothetical protein [Polyangiaceae bacterium]
MRRLPWSRKALVATLLASAGCTAVTDVDRFGSSLEEPKGNYRTLDFTITGMVSHISKYFEMRLIDGRGWTQFIAISDPFEPDEVARFVAPSVVPRSNANEYRLDFFGDMNNDRVFNDNQSTDTEGKFVDRDHSWRIERLDRAQQPMLRIEPNRIRVNYVHNTEFKDLNVPPRPTEITGSPVSITLTKLDRFYTKRLEVRIFSLDEGEPRTIGLFRVARVKEQPEITVTLPEIIRESNTPYEISVYVDANGNDEYDDPSRGRGDLGWRFRVTSQADRTLRVGFDPDETESNVAVGEP